MTEDTDVAPSEATEKGVSEDTKPKGQEQTPPADAEETPKGEEKAEEQKSASQARRERRKAEMTRLRGEAEKARAAEQVANDRLARIRDAANAAQPPKEADFPDYNDYLVAMAAHQSVAALDKRETSALETEAAEAKAKAEAIQEQRNQELNVAWGEQVMEAKTRYADWDEVANDPTLPVSDTMAGLIKGSDVGADVYYHLATNRAEAAQIYGMEPLEAARAIGAIEARMSLPRARTQTEAPEPLTPVRPGGSPPGAKNPEEMSADEYRKARESGQIR